MKKESLVERLHAAQEKDRKTTHIKEAELSAIAKDCGAPPSQAYGVATFYTMLSVKPRGKHIVRICRNLACHMDGAENLLKALKSALKTDIGGTSPDGEFTLEETSCLGMCDKAPAIMVDDVMHGNVTPAKIKAILKQAKSGGHNK